MPSTRRPHNSQGNTISSLEPPPATHNITTITTRRTYGKLYGIEGSQESDTKSVYVSMSTYGVAPGALLGKLYL
jgi:hypothetical protein